MSDDSDFTREENDYMREFAKTHFDKTYEEIDPQAIEEMRLHLIERYERVMTRGALKQKITACIAAYAAEIAALELKLKTIKFETFAADEVKFLFDFYIKNYEIPLWALLEGERYEDPFTGLTAEFNRKFRAAPPPAANGKQCDLANIINVVQILYTKLPRAGVKKDHAWKSREDTRRNYRGNYDDDDCGNYDDDDDYHTRNMGGRRPEPDDIYQ